MTDTLPQALDDWDPWNASVFWARVLKSPEMQSSRGYPVTLAALPLTRLWDSYERGGFADDDPYDEGVLFDP